MSYCRDCRRHYSEPEDEQGDHPCPSCGQLPFERESEDQHDSELDF